MVFKSTAFKKSIIITIISFLFSDVTLMAAEKSTEKLPDPITLLKESVKAIYTNNEESLYVMKLVGSGGDVSIRKMKVWFKSKSQESDAKLMIKFTEPADIRGTGFLTIAEKGKAPDQYLYLPALKKSRRIKGGNSDEPFLGSDFSMGDLSVDKEDGLEYKVTGIRKNDGNDCYEVVGSLKAGADKGAVTYSKKVYLIRKDNFLGVRGEFYNQAGQLEKVMTMPKISKDGNRYVANQIEMKNLLTNHATVLEFEKRDNKKVIPDHIFSVNFLERN